MARAAIAPKTTLIMETVVLVAAPAAAVAEAEAEAAMAVASEEIWAAPDGAKTCGR